MNDKPTQQEETDGGFDQEDVVVVEFIEPSPIGTTVTAGFLILGVGIITLIMNWSEFSDPTYAYWPYKLLSFSGIVAGVVIPIWGWRVRRREHFRAARLMVEAQGRPGRGAKSSVDRAARLQAVFFSSGIGPGVELDERPILQRLSPALERLDESLPRVTLDHRIAQPVSSIERPEHLIESEPVTSTVYRNRWAWPILVFVFLGWAFWKADGGACVFVGFVVTGISLALMLYRSLTQGLRPNDSGLHAGVGFLEGSDGTRVGSWQAHTLVLKPKWGKLRVLILTQELNHEIQFTSASDPGFVEFWQRWMHPHPRPELVGDGGS